MKRARIYLAEVRVECPHCEDPIPNVEGDSTWGECVGGQTGKVTCDECGATFVIPDVYQRVGTRLRFRKP